MCSHLSPVRPQFCYTSKLPDICCQSIFSLTYSSRRKFRQSAADPIGSAAEQICSAQVRRVRGGFRGGLFYSASKMNLADSAADLVGPTRTYADPGGVRRGIVPPLRLPRTRAGVFQSFPRRKFRQSAADPPWSEADCRGTNLVRRVRGGFRVGNFYSAKNKNCRIPRRRQSDPLGPTRTQADSIGVRRAAELFRQLYYRYSASSRRSPRGFGWSPPVSSGCSPVCPCYGPLISRARSARRRRRRKISFQGSD